MSGEADSPHADQEIRELRALRDRNAADLATATDLLQKAALQLALHMDDSGVIDEIGRFAARRVGK